MKLYIAVLTDVPDYIVPTLVAHTVLNAHIKFSGDPIYDHWLSNSFKKCVLRVGSKEFGKITQLGAVHIGYENKTLDGSPSCVVVRPYAEPQDLPNVLKFAKLWAPKDQGLRDA